MLDINHNVLDRVTDRATAIFDSVNKGGNPFKLSAQCLRYTSNLNRIALRAMLENPHCDEYKWRAINLIMLARDIGNSWANWEATGRNVWGNDAR